MPLDLQNIERIRLQKARYCRLLDTKAFDELGSLFTPDATFTFRNEAGEPAFSFGSTAEFISSARELFATTKTVHQAHPGEIEFVAPTEARAIWPMEDWHVHAPDGNEPPRTMHGYGFYHETWRLVGDDWRLASVDLHRTIVFNG